MSKEKDKKYKEKYGIETGYSSNGLPFVKIGDSSNILVNIEALSFKHEPPSGFELKMFYKQAKYFADDYTVYLVGRRPNLPENYLFDKMANDYADLIRSEFGNPVDIIGVSTGGQLAHYLAADHPDVVNKLVIISAAYRLSEKGVELERKTAEFFKKGKYGKAMSNLMDLMYSSRLAKLFIKPLIRMMGKRIMGDIEYPNDFLLEVQADREMDFESRLSEIKAPTLVLSGKEDIGYSAEDVRKTAEGIPNAELKLYEGYGHNLTMVNWKEVRKDILTFLKKK